MGRPSLKDLARSEAHEALTRSIATALEQGQTIPCVGSCAWISDHPRLQAEAARKCLDCPLIQQCGDYASEHKEQAGVWGGTCRDGTRQHSICKETNQRHRRSVMTLTESKR